MHNRQGTEGVREIFGLTFHDRITLIFFSSMAPGDGRLARMWVRYWLRGVFGEFRSLDLSSSHVYFFSFLVDSFEGMQMGCFKGTKAYRYRYPLLFGVCGALAFLFCFCLVGLRDLK